MALASLPLIGGRGRNQRVVGYVLLDAEDAARFGGERWSVTPQGYAVRYEYPRVILLHREILGLPRETDWREGDHINRNPLDCRRVNLRVVSHGQNLQNKSKYKNGVTSRHRGVYLDEGYWRATVTVAGRKIRKWCHSEAEAAQFAARTRAEHMPFSEDAGLGL